MQRLFEKKMMNWVKSGMKKPLMVIGVRQIGKTYTINQFCKNNFKEVLYFNIELDKDIKEIFENTLDDIKIIEQIELKIGKKIDIKKTIMFFDEIQVSEKFITSLKYFCESKLNYKIVCAGSLLGVKINRFSSSFPVGKVRMEYMYPMNFLEFLMALKEEMLIDKIRNCYKDFSSMPNFLHEKAIYLYKLYLCIGGMPEAVANFLECNNDVMLFDTKILSNIVDMYIADMNKYTISSIESIKIEKVYKNIPSQWAKENKRFKYALLEETARKRHYQTAIEWLVAGNMILECNNVTKPEKPLKVYKDEDNFKLYLSDVGILTNLSEVKLSDIMLDTLFMFKGALSKNYIAQEFKSQEVSLYYWTSKRNAELDFLIYNQDGIIPVEIKSSYNNTSKSLGFYIDKFNPSYAIRISPKNFGFENNIKSIPLYAVFCLAEEISKSK
ncbi:MAG: AAA family ATPase [Bacilli bacterium]